MLDLQNRFVPPETDDVLELVDAYLSGVRKATRHAGIRRPVGGGDADLLPARDARFTNTLAGSLDGSEAMAGVLVAPLRGVLPLRPDHIRAQVRALLADGVA